MKWTEAAELLISGDANRIAYHPSTPGGFESWYNVMKNEDGFSYSSLTNDWPHAFIPSKHHLESNAWEVRQYSGFNYKTIAK